MTGYELRLTLLDWRSRLLLLQSTLACVATAFALLLPIFTTVQVASTLVATVQPMLTRIHVSQSSLVSTCYLTRMLCGAVTPAAQHILSREQTLHHGTLLGLRSRGKIGKTNLVDACQLRTRGDDDETLQEQRLRTDPQTRCPWGKQGLRGSRLTVTRCPWAVRSTSLFGDAWT